MAWANGTQREDKILVRKSAGRGPLKKPPLDLNGDLDGRHRLDLPGCG